MKIALDLDDVLLDFIPALATFHNKRYGTSLTKKDFHSYYFADVWGGTVDEAIQKMHIFYDSKYFDNMLPVEGSVEGVNYLKKEHDLLIATSRIVPPEKTFISLDTHFADTFSRESVYFAYNHWTGCGHSNKTKAEICIDKNVDILIEDSIEYANEVASKGIPVLIPNQPWNENHKIHNNVKRVYSWGEIVYLLSHPNSLSKREISSL